MAPEEQKLDGGFASESPNEDETPGRALAATGDGSRSSAGGNATRDLINGRFGVRRWIGDGFHGRVHLGYDYKCERKVAVKFQQDSKGKRLKREYDVYKALHAMPNVLKNAFPRVYWYGEHGGDHVLVMDLLGPTIHSLFIFCNRHFDERSIYWLGEHMVRVIEQLHMSGYVHRDVKPQNMALDRHENEDTVRLFDFSLAKRCIVGPEGARRNRHISTNTNMLHATARRNVGTCKYRSINSLRGCELSRRDDMESLAYVLVEIINGKLPWEDALEDSRHQSKWERNKRVLRVMENTVWQCVCPSMERFIAHCRSLPFDKTPNYDFLVDCLWDWFGSDDHTWRKMRRLLKTSNCSYTNRFWWLFDSDHELSRPASAASSSALCSSVGPSSVSASICSSSYFTACDKSLSRSFGHRMPVWDSAMPCLGYRRRSEAACKPKSRRSASVAPPRTRSSPAVNVVIGQLASCHLV